MAELTKICPGCGVANLPTRSFCWKCDADLANVAPTPIPRIAWRTATEPKPTVSALARAWAEVAGAVPAKPSATPLLVLAGLVVAFAACFVLNNLLNTTRAAGEGLSGAAISLSAPAVAVPDVESIVADPFAVPPGTTVRYHVVELKPFDVGDLTRTRARITVPAGLTRSDLNANIRHAIKAIYDRRPVDALALFVYQEGANVYGSDTVAKALFVPEGDWMRAAHGTPLGRFRVNIEAEDAYLKATPAPAVPHAGGQEKR
jgi:hypothetical protein